VSPAIRGLAPVKQVMRLGIVGKAVSEKDVSMERKVWLVLLVRAYWEVHDGMFRKLRIDLRCSQSA
jgi:hypothetical protein